MSDNDEIRRRAALLRKVLSRGGTLESTEGSAPISNAELKQAVRKQLAKTEAQPSLPVTVAASQVVEGAESAMRKVEQENVSAVTDFEFACLEAVVLITGRPAMRYKNGRVEMPDPNGDNVRWSTFVAIARSFINEASASVGRVGLAHDNAADDPVATAWRLGDDLVVTNRHVARDIVSDATIAPADWKLDSNKHSVVDFTVTDNSAKSVRFPIKELVYCASDIDLAIFRLDPKGEKLPDPLELDWEEVFKDEEIYIVGHPYRLSASNAVSTVFVKADGYKRCSPGLVTAIDAEPRVFEHDCSTLGGNSGSCVLSVSGHAVVGLHYGGLNVDTITDIARANAAVAISKLKDHPAGEILKKGHA